MISKDMKNWILRFEPNDEGMVNFLCKCLFQPKVSISSENMVTILHEYPRVRSDFVFAASIAFFEEKVMNEIIMCSKDYPIPGLS